MACYECGKKLDPWGEWPFRLEGQPLCSAECALRLLLRRAELD